MQIGDIVSEENLMETCIQYWNNVEIVKELEDPEIEKVIYQKIRKKIIDILGEGVTIEDPSTGNKRKIHVLSASQLQEILNEESDEKIRKSNLYFHLQKLEDYDLIEPICFTRSGKRLTSYFGRTARVFVISTDLKDNIHESNLLEDPEFISFVNEIAPSVKPDTIRDIIGRANRINRDLEKTSIKQWIADNEQIIRKSDIDIRKLFNILQKIILFDDQTIQGLRDLGKLLDIDVPN